MLQEYDITLTHIEGKDNYIAGALTRLPRIEDEDPFGSEAIISPGKLNFIQYCLITEIEYPLSIVKISHEQENDPVLKRIRINGPSPNDKDYDMTSYEETEVVTYKVKIFIPTSLTESIIDWYHDVLRHPGKERTLRSINQHFYWKKMKEQIFKFVEDCEICSKLKRRTGSRYGHLPLKDTEDDCTPWQRVYRDSIGPW